MKVDPLCQLCTKSCKQIRPAIVVSCAKFTPTEIKQDKSTRELIS